MIRYRIHHAEGTFEVEAWSHARCLELVRAECADRGWLVDDTWEERLK